MFDFFKFYIFQDSKGYYTLTTQGLQRKDDIESLLSSIIQVISEYEETLEELISDNQGNPVFESLKTGMEMLLKFLKAYQNFLQAILNSGDPSKSNPKEIVLAIGVFLENLMNTVQDVDIIIASFKVDSPSLADKILIEVKKLPNDAREVFKALTKICLINESSSTSDGAILVGDAEQTMIDALSLLKTNVESLRFLFNRELKTGQESLNILNSTMSILKLSLLVNELTLSDVQSSILFRYSLATSSLEIGLKVTKDFIFKKFPSITEFDEVVQKIGEQKSVFDNVAVEIIESINQLLTNFRMSYDRKVAEKVEKIQIAFGAMRKSISNLLKRNSSRIENITKCLARDDFEGRVKNVADAMLNASSSVEVLVLDSSTLIQLINGYDAYVFKVARVIIRTNNDDELDANLNEVN